MFHYFPGLLVTHASCFQAPAGLFFEFLQLFFSRVHLCCWCLSGFVGLLLVKNSLSQKCTFINSNDHDDVDADVDVYHQSKSSRHQHAAEVQLQPWWLPLSACVAPMLPAGSGRHLSVQGERCFFSNSSLFTLFTSLQKRECLLIFYWRLQRENNTHLITTIFRNKCHALAISWLQALPHSLWTTTSSIHITHSFHILEPSCPPTFTCQMDLQGHHTQQGSNMIQLCPLKGRFIFAYTLEN